MRIVQLRRGSGRAVALVDGARLWLVASQYPSAYSLAWLAAETNEALPALVERFLTREQIDYDAVYDGLSDWRILPAFDHPGDPAHCFVSGTGLTHKASVLNRAAMHERGNPEITDSYRMFQLGLDKGKPEPGRVGVQPEWFFKGDGSVLHGHGAALSIPAYADDGGEEPEIAGAYLISSRGEPLRVGLAAGNEFSDHAMEKQNYLYLAPSKLRPCAFGPELSIGDVAFEHVPGSVSVWRDDVPLFQREIWSGQSNMSHSLANLEHHHFKYQAHRRPGDVHIHFFGADAFSFGDGLTLQSGDIMEVSFPQFGRPLRNVVGVETGEEPALVAARTL